MITKEERAFRQFLRATFKARLRLDSEGHGIGSMRGNTAKAELSNARTVMEALHNECKVVKETAKSATFAYQSGKKGPRATITLAHVGDRDILTMVTK